MLNVHRLGVVIVVVNVTVIVVINEALIERLLVAKEANETIDVVDLKVDLEVDPLLGILALRLI